MVSYVLFSDSSPDSVRAENVVEELGICQIIQKYIPAVNYGRVIEYPTFMFSPTYPSLMVTSFVEEVAGVDVLESFKNYTKATTMIEGVGTIKKIRNESKD